MKLFRHQGADVVVPGLLDAHGKARSLAGLVSDITVQSIQTISKGDANALPLITEPLRYLPPLSGIRQIIAAGLNYRQHALEAGMPIPQEPILFSKAITSLSGANDYVVMPKGSEATDYEAELAVVMARDTYEVPLQDAISHVLGYCIANDVSERDFQLKRGGGQWLKGKSSPSFTPLGPWLVTADEVPDPQSLDIQLSVNGELRQHSSTADMIFGVAQLVSHASQFMRLLAGDVLLTGTPQGVGMGFKPPRYLMRGDALELQISGLGVQQQAVI